MAFVILENINKVIDRWTAEAGRGFTRHSDKKQGGKRMRKEKALVLLRCAGLTVAGILAGCGGHLAIGTENALAADEAVEELSENLRGGE